MSRRTHAAVDADAHAILLYYAYIELDATTEHAWHDALARSLGLGGRLRISSQGLNGTLSGREAALREYSRAVTARHGEHGTRIDWKFGEAELHQLFPELSCRIVSEVVSLGVDPLQAPLQLAGRHLNPTEFHEELQRAAASDVRNVVLLDARNVYETRIGRFAAANVPTLLPQIRQFSDSFSQRSPEFRSLPMVGFHVRPPAEWRSLELRGKLASAAPALDLHLGNPSSAVRGVQCEAGQLQRWRKLQTLKHQPTVRQCRRGPDRNWLVSSSQAERVHRQYPRPPFERGEHASPERETALGVGAHDIHF